MKNKKEIRNAFKTRVFERDKHQCKVCGQKTLPLDAHHITDRNEMPHGGYVLENGISLCHDCHWKAEEWHRSEHQTWAIGFHPDDLYRLIGSSKALAIAQSEKALG